MLAVTSTKLPITPSLSQRAELLAVSRRLDDPDRGRGPAGPQEGALDAGLLERVGVARRQVDVLVGRRLEDHLAPTGVADPQADHPGQAELRLVEVGLVPVARLVIRLREADARPEVRSIVAFLGEEQAGVDPGVELQPRHRRDVVQGEHPRVPAGVRSRGIVVAHAFPSLRLMAILNFSRGIAWISANSIGRGNRSVL